MRTYQLALVFIFFDIPLLACGGAEPNPFAPKLPMPDAAVIYVTPDAAPPPSCTCTCSCSSSCTCDCDCGPVEVVPVTPPEEDAQGPVATEADAGGNAAEKDSAPIQSVADPRLDAAANKDQTVGDSTPPKDGVLAAADSADSAAVKDSSSVPDLPTAKDTVSVPDATAIKDTYPVADLPPTPDIGPDLPPPDTRPCTGPRCSCPAEAACGLKQLLTLPPIASYAPFASDDLTTTEDGYGIYASKSADLNIAHLSLQLTPLSGPPAELDIGYDMNQASPDSYCGNYSVHYGHWFSVRRQFAETQDFCGCNGVSFEIAANISSPRPEAGLRLTLADVACERTDGGVTAAGADELWRYDIPKDRLSPDWQAINVPVESFVLSSVRGNDRKLNLRCIVAFELSYYYDYTTNCSSCCRDQDIVNGSGTVNIRNLTTY